MQEELASSDHVTMPTILLEHCSHTSQEAALSKLNFRGGKAMLFKTMYGENDAFAFYPSRKGFAPQTGILQDGLV